MEQQVEKRYRAEDKWGEAANVGFSQIPDTLFKAQAALNIDPVEMNVLVNLISFWWMSDKMPFPSASAIAKRMGVQGRTVRQALARLHGKWLIAREPLQGYGPSRYTYSLQPLVTQVKTLARRDPRYKREVLLDG